VDDLLQWREKQLDMSQKLREEERLEEEQERRKWMRKSISKRASRFGVCVVTCVVTCFFITLERPYLSAYGSSLEDFQQRVLKGGGTDGGVEPSIVQICRQINDIAVSGDSEYGAAKKTNSEEENQNRAGDGARVQFPVSFWIDAHDVSLCCHGSDFE